MDVNAIIQAIQTLGFPIAVCGALFWFIVKEQRGLKEIIDNNTVILSRILEHLKKEDK